MQLRRAEPEELDEVGRGPEGVGDDRAVRGRERGDDRSVALRDEHRVGGHGSVDELGELPNRPGVVLAGCAGCAISRRPPT